MDFGLIHARCLWLAAGIRFAPWPRPRDDRGMPRTVNAAAADDDLIGRLAAIAGPQAVITDEDERRFHSQDANRAGALPLAVFRPKTVEDLAAGVAAACGSGVAVFPRGGGMSYTDGFLPDRTDSLVIDTGALDRVVELSAEDLHVTVEAGCTWAKLHDALEPLGLRTPFWGPFSGHTATVGGSMSQGTATFGTARVGTSGDNVIAFDVVTADGRILRTGPAGQPGHAPFTRQYGPDLTGLFANDAGALGIKARVTLPLEPRPAAVAGLSFLFAGFADLVDAMRAIAREGLASESFAMDPVVTRQFSGGPTSFAQDLATLLTIGRAEGSALRGAVRMAQVALAGRRFLGREGYQLHVVVEADDRRSLDAKRARVRALAKAGVELPNTVPTAVRAVPFSPLPVLSPEGKRVLPIHGILPFSQAPELDRAIHAIVADHRAETEDAGVVVATSFFGVGRNGLLYEPVIYWPDAASLYHRRRSPAGMPAHADNPAARAVVERLTTAMIDAMYARGATHLQIGRVYPYLRDRDPAFVELLRAIKAELDPRGLVNPGALGL